MDLPSNHAANLVLIKDIDPTRKVNIPKSASKADHIGYVSKAAQSKVADSFSENKPNQDLADIVRGEN